MPDDDFEHYNHDFVVLDLCLTFPFQPKFLGSQGFIKVGLWIVHQLNSIPLEVMRIQNHLSYQS